MKKLYIAGDSPALVHAQSALSAAGIPFSSTPDEAEVLLYNVPTAAFLREDIPRNRLIIGGNLDFLADDVPKLDLLKDPGYVTANAALTAEAALGILLSKLECGFASASTLVIGWGRIGKCLAKLLKSIGIPVAVLARKPEDRAMLTALGYEAVSPKKPLRGFQCVINTAPAQILDPVPMDAIKIDLASIQGIPGADVIHARGLPGKYKPEASGELIVQTILRHREEVF